MVKIGFLFILSTAFLHLAHTEIIILAGKLFQTVQLLSQDGIATHTFYRPVPPQEITKQEKTIQREPTKDRKQEANLINMGTRIDIDSIIKGGHVSEKQNSDLLSVDSFQVPLLKSVPNNNVISTLSLPSQNKINPRQLITKTKTPQKIQNPTLPSNQKINEQIFYSHAVQIPQLSLLNFIPPHPSKDLDIIS